MKLFQHKSGIVPYLAVAAAAFLVYANAIDGQFVFDDWDLFRSDPEAYTLDKLPDHFTGAEGYHQSMGRYYRPAAAATYILDFASAKAFFNDIDARTFHVTNILIHAAASVLALRLLVVVCGGLWAPLAGALLFAVHPVHTEAVAWISGRTDSLSFLFYAAAFLCYLRFRRRCGWPGLAGVFLFYLAALLSKEMAVTFPAAVILFDLTLGRKDGPPLRPRVLVYGSLAALTGLFLIWRGHVLAGVPEREAYLYFHGKDWVTTAATMLQTLPVYARLLVAPVGLLYHYDGTLPDQTTFLATRVLLSLGFVAATAAAALFLWRRRPAIAFAIVFFYLSLLPVLNVLAGQSLMAERFLYLPSFALSLIAADLLRSVRARPWQIGAFAAAAAAVVLFAGLTVARNEDWRDDSSLYRSAEGWAGTVLSVNLGNEYGRAGDFDRAEALYREALALRPDHMDAYLNLGVLYIQKGDRRGAEAARAESRGDPIAALSLRSEAQGLYGQAAEFLTKARAIDPLSPKPLHSLVVCAMRRSLKAEAIGYLEEMKRLVPGDARVDNLLEQLRADVME